MKPAVEPVIDLLHAATFGTLATQSVRLPGYPYATVIPNVLDECHRPLLLISALAEHTRNLLADPRLSLSLLEPNCANVQTAARLTLIGDAERFEPGDLLQARYLRYLPDAEQYLQLDFMFFRIAPKRLRPIAGLGRMGWLEADDFSLLPSISLETENRLLDSVQQAVPEGISILGIDRYGIDYQADGLRKRQGFGETAVREEHLETMLHRVVMQLALEKSGE
jgi:hypothetical protein